LELHQVPRRDNHLEGKIKFKNPGHFISTQRQKIDGTEKPQDFVRSIWLIKKSKKSFWFVGKNPLFTGL